ncbi:MAG: diphthine synthase [Halobacteriales archaeon]
MLTFVGLGLYDERSVTLEGRDAIRAADRVFAEFYTSRLAGTTLSELEAAHDVGIEVRNREGVEREPAPILDAAAEGEAAFLTAGDPMVSTTHVDLRLRADDRGLDTRIVHGTSAATAAAGLTGLQNYRFGAATTLPFPETHGGVPDSVRERIEANRGEGLHTLVYLDIEADDAAGAGLEDGEYLHAGRAAALLAEVLGDGPAVAIARAGSPDPVVDADRLPALADRRFGDPLHLLVVPGDLHPMEADALRAFGDAPADVLPGP